MKIPSNKLTILLRPSVQKLYQIFNKHNYEVRVIGGAVRDFLMNKIPYDLDFATTATPNEMKNMFRTEGISTINMRGEKHATITAHINKSNLECTTLRKVKIIDGREEVEFTSDWRQDAKQRDFTVNAMSLGFDGTVHDYLNGLQHLKERKVKFIDNPDDKLIQHPSRILRYFRFFGMITDDPHNHDPKAIASIIRNSDRLSKVPGEVMTNELQKILTGKYNIEMLQKMIDCGLNEHIGLSHDFDCENVKKIYKNLKGDMYDYTLLLAAGMASEEELIPLFNKVKFSKNEKHFLHFVIKHRNLFYNMQSVQDIKNILVDFVYEGEIDKEEREKMDNYKVKKIDRRKEALELTKQLLLYVGRSDLLDEVNDSLIPSFPIKERLLVGKVKEESIHSEMKRLFDLWKESDFMLNRRELLNKM